MGLKMCVDALDPPVGATRQPGAIDIERLLRSSLQDFAYTVRQR